VTNLIEAEYSCSEEHLVLIEQLLQNYQEAKLDIIIWLTDSLVS
jgi:hypothetical protein